MQRDFGEGKISKIIFSQAIPLTFAQLVQLLYNIVDRIYIGHITSAHSSALTGIGLTFPVISLIAAFTSLFGTGGSTLYAISRGADEKKRARLILGNTVLYLLVTALVLMVTCLLFAKPILFLFGASESSYVYAKDYLQIYLLGTVFVMLSSGLNGFISAQGSPEVGMMTVILGAVLNLVLDPVFIFVFHMGVRGAAIATIISQLASMIWVIKFLTSEKAIDRITTDNMKFCLSTLKEVVAIGTSGFIMSGTNCLVQIVCNKTLMIYGGDLYVGVMTVISSVRDVTFLPVHSLVLGAQPVLGYNFGAKKYSRVKEGIRFAVGIVVVYTILVWIAVLVFSKPIMCAFSSDAALIKVGARALGIFFFGFCFMACQSSGQMVFQSLGYAKSAIFFSLLRKAFIVVPLTIVLPRVGLGVDGVFVAEPISNVAGGLACFITMLFTVYRKLGTNELTKN